MTEIFDLLEVAKHFLMHRHTDDLATPKKDHRRLTVYLFPAAARGGKDTRRAMSKGWAKFCSRTKIKLERCFIYFKHEESDRSKLAKADVDLPAS